MSLKACLEISVWGVENGYIFDTLISTMSFLLEIVNELEILMTPMDGEVCFIFDHLCYGIFKHIFQMSLRFSF